MSRGLAKMTPERVREICSKGGAATPPEKRSFSKDRSLASEAGRIGGISVDPAKRSFSKNPSLAAEAGRKGGGKNKGKLDPAYVEAKEKGEKLYVPAKPCRNGHRLRYTASRQCASCAVHPERDK